MTYEIMMSEDGILKITFNGNLDGSEMNSFLKDLTPFLEAATEDRPLRSLINLFSAEKISSSARKNFMQLNSDLRLGNMAWVGDNRPFRVLSKFMLKASGRENIRLFENEEEAYYWLHTSTSKHESQDINLPKVSEHA